MDGADCQILDMLQEDATLTAFEISERIGLPEALCAERIAKFEESGVIQGRVVLLNPRDVGAKMTVFVAITAPEHSEDWLAKFHTAVESFPEVLEFYRMSGQVDYLLRVVVPDIEAYDAFYKKLIAAATLKDISSTIAIEQIKFTTKLPIRLAE